MLSWLQGRPSAFCSAKNPSAKSALEGAETISWSCRTLLQGQKRHRSFVQQQNYELSLLIAAQATLDFRKVWGAAGKRLERSRSEANTKWVTVSQRGRRS